jgi:hypothetical protein
MTEVQNPSEAAGSPDSNCPYCQASLAKRPQRKSKCRSCGKPIFVKTLPSTRERVLVTEDQAQAIEAEWTAIYHSSAIEGLALHYHLDVDVFRARRAARSDLSDHDIIWGMFNEDLQSLMKQGDLHGLSCRYYEMALFAGGEDRDFTQLLEACHKMSLSALKATGGVEKVQIMTCGSDSCEACQNLDGKTLTIDEALHTMPLPCKGCTMNVVGTRPGFCRCLYTAVVS